MTIAENILRKQEFYKRANTIVLENRGVEQAKCRWATVKDNQGI